MRSVFAGIALAMSSASPAVAEVIEAGDAGFVLRYGAQVPAPPLDVWKQLLRPAEWWSGDHTYSGDAANLWLDGQATGCFCEKLPRPADLPEGLRAGSAEHLRVIYVEPPRALRLSGALGPLQADPVDAVMTITLKPVDGGTRIAMEYVASGFIRLKPADMAPVLDKVLAEQVGRLAARFAPAADGAVEAAGADGAPAGPAPAAALSAAD